MPASAYDLQAAMNQLTGFAPAKINLTLRVCGRRADGFHEIESLIARLSLCDELTVCARPDEQITLHCNDPTIPADEQNLVVRAATALRQTTGCRRGAHIILRKQIPVGSGLGGGSSDAATTLLLLNRLWSCGLSSPQLAEMGASIGSDVPLFFSTPLCIVRGRGDRVEPLDRTLGAEVLLLVPPIRLPTAAVYRAWDRLGPTPGRPAVENVIEHLAHPDRLATMLFNDLEEAAGIVRPELAHLAAELRRACGCPLHMTGSGSAFFCLGSAAASDLRTVAQIVRSICPQVHTIFAKITA
jgi:4-diphosphocytidyl-2-C-methyl-D-erythritol kinase